MSKQENKAATKSIVDLRIQLANDKRQSLASDRMK